MNVYLKCAFCALVLSLSNASASSSLEQRKHATLVNEVVSEPLSRREKAELIERTLAVFKENYIDTKAIARVTELIRLQHENGKYRAVSTLNDFAEVIGNDFKLFADDLHLSLSVKRADEPVTHILSEQRGKLTYNKAFETVSYLHGNTGYLKFNKFYSTDDARDVADAAFAFLKNSGGLIIDMRDTVGGSPYLAQYMLSYFVSPKTPLWSVRSRDQSISQQADALDSPKHNRFQANYPVWILTSQQTASASELFAGVMQAQGKAVLVGEQTAGAGFYVGARKITEQLVFRISLSKPVLAVTNTNWEKSGLTPDVVSESVDALDVAIALSLNQ